jgi:hypothetical protein
MVSVNDWGMAYSGSAADRLARIREAIDNCLDAQSYTTRGRGKVNALLATLLKKEEQLQDEADQEANGGCMASLACQSPPT